MKKAWIGFLCLGFILGFGAPVIRAEEAAAPAQPAAKAPAPAPEPAGPEEELEYTFGTVKSVAADSIVITEFDYDSGEEKDAVYAVDPKVELNNAASLKEIAQGDEVDIDYKVEDDKKIAEVISVAKPLPAEAETGE